MERGWRAFHRVRSDRLVGGFYLCAQAGFLHDVEDPQRTLEAWRD